MSEKLHTPKTFEQNTREIEQKFLPINPAKLDAFRSNATPMEQIYLSHPSEDFNLRIRQSVKQGKASYKATLKDTGNITPAGLDRLEIETPINPQVHEYYRKLGRPLLRKLRAEPITGVVIDYFEDGHIHAESEDPRAWQHFLTTHELHDNFVDVTGHHTVDNEWRAHFDHYQQYGYEALTPQPSLNTDTMRLDILEHQVYAPHTIVRIAGRSGSGKSTVVRELQTKLAEADLMSVVLSTDDYHRGNTWLVQHNNGEVWTDWDAPVVYDRATLAADIARLQNGEKIPARQINFTTVEQEIVGELAPAPVIIIEGIYAGHTDFDHADLSYEITTPLATCIGRRVLRDIVERPQFDPASNIRYILENAEPAWLAQHKD